MNKGICWALLLFVLQFAFINGAVDEVRAAEYERVLVKDIYPGYHRFHDLFDGFGNDSDPGNFAEYNGVLFFKAEDGDHGTELWRSDGTEAGTVMVKDIRPGSDDSNPSGFFEYDGMLLFSANDGDHGYALWRSDGTEAGTFMVKDIIPKYYSYPDKFFKCNGMLFFIADDGDHGAELWRSDGTEDGTFMVTDIRSGDTGSSPNSFFEHDGMLLFSANDGVHGRELWRSDGTEAGTVMVKDISPESSSFPVLFVECNGMLFFIADDGAHGRELWRSDGTEDGTVMVKDIRPGADNSLQEIYYENNNMYEYNGMLFFMADDGVHGIELWRSDGTEAGTVMVKDLWPGLDSSVSNSSNLFEYNGMLYFGANDGIFPEIEGLWKTDGTEAGTVPVMRNIQILSGYAISSLASDSPYGDYNREWSFFEYDGTLFFKKREYIGEFIAFDTIGSSDGTRRGTNLLPKVNRFIPYIRDIRQVNDILYFTGPHLFTGEELFKLQPVDSPIE